MSWTEISKNGEGISVSVYEDGPDGLPTLVEETYWTWRELEEMDHGRIFRHGMMVENEVVKDGC